MLAAIPQTYVVQTGDNLSSISFRLFGNADKWPVLYEANQKLIGANPNLIYPGQILVTAIGGYAPKHGTNKAPVTVTSSTVPSGNLTCSGLESLWNSAGGNPNAAFLAAEIAEAESGGRQYATGAAGERGYWQINPDHGALSTYDALGNAKAAIVISDNGRDWDAWTTYVDGLFAGRC